MLSILALLGQCTRRILRLSPLLALVFSFSLILPQGAQAIPLSAISQVYFFGDSLSDSGFNNNITALNGFPNKAPTFTTYGGYTWAQYVARDIKGIPLPLGPFPNNNDKITNNTTPTFPGPVPFVIPDLTGVNYACGGSTTASNPGFNITWAPSLAQQIQHFLANSPATLDPNAVFFIWSGANDILTALNQSPPPNQLQLLMAVDSATSNIASQVALLGQRGAKRIVVMALPNFGSTPYVLGLSATIPGLQAEMKNVTYLFDSMLNQKLGQVINQFGVSVLYFNTYQAMDKVISYAQLGLPYIINGETFTFVNVTDPVCGPGVSSLFCPSPSSNYFFADEVHPTDQTHRILSLEIENSIQAWL